jgi:hypothetical protein
LTKRFVVFGDFNFDAIFIVDVYMGGILGQLVLHDEQLDPENQGVSYQDVEGGLPNAIQNWTKPVGLTTCDTCLDLWMTSHKRFNFYRIRLTRPLMEMADNADFTEFADSIIEPYNPWGLQKKQPFDDGQWRYMAMKRDGSIGFFAHQVFGLFQFLERNEKGENVLQVSGSKMITNDSGLTGVTMNQDDTRLLVTSEKYIYVYDITGPPSLIAKYSTKNCRGNWDGQISLYDSVMVENGDIYGVGKAYKPEARAVGMNLFRIESNSNGGFGKCRAVTGGVTDFAGWVDGDAEIVRMTRPHTMNLLPGTGSSIIFTDIDNRAIRVADVSMTPVHVSTVSYDENLWKHLYVSESCTESQEIGVPRELPNAKSSMNFLQAQRKCIGENERLCSLAELRGYWSQEPLPAGRTIMTWTDKDCHSCWLFYYGVCFPPSEDDSQSLATVVGSAWGSENQMLAFLTTSTEGLPRVQTECTNKNKVIETDVICCPQHKNVRFHGRVSFNSNDNEGYKGPVLVKLIRRQPSPSEFKYMTLSKVHTEEDGTFEMAIETVCNDSTYYLKFSLDKRDSNEFEFLAGNSVKVKRGNAISTPRRIAHGNDYEINAAVVRKACHLGDPASFHGRVWMDLNANAQMDDSEEGYPGIVSVKLIRRRPSNLKFQYTGAKVVFTNEDGTFDIRLESVCDDSTYYLKFELDGEDYKFIKGGDISIKREVGYSSPTNVVHGGQYEINAGVRPNTARIESEKVP